MHHALESQKGWTSMETWSVQPFCRCWSAPLGVLYALPINLEASHTSRSHYPSLP